MKLLLLSTMLPFIAISGCADKQLDKAPGYFGQGKEETSECFSYRQMMTAPIAPSAIKDLQEKCRQSRSKQ